MMGELLRQYTEARMNERLHLFLQFPELRRSFQEIDRKDLSFQKASISLSEEHDKIKYSLRFLSLRNLYHRIISLLSCLGSQLRPDGKEAARQDQAAAYKMIRPEGFSEQNHPQYRSVNGEHVIEYHSPVRSDPAYPFVP